MRLIYRYKTRVGPFYIGVQNGRYHPIFDNNSLGSYARAWQAAEDLSGGHTYSPSCAADPADLGIPADVSEWERI